MQSRGLVEHHAGQGESSTRPKNDILKLKKESEHNVLSIHQITQICPVLTFPVFDVA